MFHPVRSITNQLFKAPRIPILKFVRYKPFPRLVTHLQGISPPITDSYSLTKYKTPPLNFSQAVAALRAYSLVDRDEYVNLKLDLNLFDAKKRKQVVQLLSSVIVFPNQFTEESSVFILCSDSEGESARKAGATGYLEERHFNKLESMEMTHDYYLATEAVADAVREIRKVFRHKLPNRKKGSIVQAEQLKEAVHRFLATTTLSFVKLKTDKTMALLDMDFGKLSFTDTMLLENLDEILEKLKEYKEARLETFILKAYLSTEHCPSYVLSEDCYMRVNKHTADTSGLF